MINYCTLHEVFCTFNTDRIKTEKSVIGEQIGGGREYKLECAINVFKTAVKIVVDDIIDNGVQFNFPGSSRGSASMFIDTIKGESYDRFKKKKYLFRDVDPMASNFSIHRLCYLMETASGTMIKRSMRLDSGRRKRIVNKTNNGGFKLGPIKTYKDYVDEVHSLFQYLKRGEIHAILRFGFSGVRLFISYGLDLIIRQNYTEGHEKKKHREFLFCIGTLPSKHKYRLKYTLRRARTRARVMWRRLMFVHDGYYYFSLSKSRLKEIEKDLLRGKEIELKRIQLYKIYDEAIMRALNHSFLFRIKMEEDFSSRFCIIRDIKSNNIELLEVFSGWTLYNISHHVRTYKTILKEESNAYVRHIREKNKPKYAKWLQIRKEKRNKQLKDK